MLKIRCVKLYQPDGSLPEIMHRSNKALVEWFAHHFQIDIPSSAIFILC